MLAVAAIPPPGLEAQGSLKSPDRGDGVRAPRTLDASKRWFLFVAAAVLLVLPLQALPSSTALSAAFDEPYHLGAGYAYLKTGDVRLHSDHPPLIDGWLAVPGLLLNPRLPLDSPAWQRGEYGSFGDVFLWESNSELALRLIWLGRFANILLAVLLGALIIRWTSRMSNRAAGLLAVTLYVFDPGIVANASMNTNDLGVAALLFGATWAWWRWLERPTRIRLVAAGLLAGAACASKYSGLAIGPIALLLAFVHPTTAGPVRTVWLRRAGALAGVAVICLLTIWAVYGFTTDGGIPAPAFWEGIRFQGSRLVDGQPAYALGEVWPSGVWFYYPLALALKTPLPVLILAALGLFVAVKRGRGRVILPFALPLAVFAAVALASSLQLGHRYLMPMLPFMFGLAGYATTGLSWPLRRRRDLALASAVGVLMIWLMLNAVTIYPHHLSFFNEVAGGAAGADWYLVDANLDWGQDLPALKSLMGEYDLPYVHLGYFGSSVPDVYGIRYWPGPGFLRFVEGPESMSFNPYTPEPGWYAISRTSLWQGLVLTHPDLYAFFRSRTPKASAGYSINLYHVDYPPSTAVVRAVVEGRRVADVPAEQLGWRAGQRLIAKWTPDNNSFVFALNGPARYIVSDPLTYAPDMREALLRHARPAAGGALEFDAATVIPPLVERWPAESPLWTPDGAPSSAPVEFEARLRLLGYRLVQDRVSSGATVSVVLLWQVTGELRPPVATFVHLLDPNGDLFSQYDGWASSVRGLESGDLVVQHVQIPTPGAAPGLYRLQLGVYSPDTMLRWQARTAGGAQIDRVWLPEVEVY